jgi:hypothetical protein
MKTVQELIAEESESELLYTEKQQKILSVANQYVDDTPAEIGRRLKNQLKDDAPSKGYVYTVLRKSDSTMVDSEVNDNTKVKAEVVEGTVVDKRMAPVNEDNDIVKTFTIRQHKDGSYKVELNK